MKTSDRVHRAQRRPARAAGVSLLEMMISVTLAMLLLGSLFSLYYGAVRGAATSENRMSSDRQGSLIVERLSRDFRLVGLMAPQDVDGDSNDIRRDVPYQPWSDSIRQDFEYANTYSVVFTGDVDADSMTETVRYYRDNATSTLREQIWKWSRDSLRWIMPVTRNVAEGVDFVMFRYFDRDGNPVPNPVTYPAGGYTLSVGERVRVTAVEITVVTRSDQLENGRVAAVSMPDGTTWHDHYRRTVERFMVRGRNLSLGA
jgi:type II secretory pathway component PulJ